MGKGNKNKKTFRKVPNTEFFPTTPCVSDRSKHNQGLKRNNEGQTSYKGTTVAQSTTTGVASSCEIDRKNDKFSLNDSGFDNVHESFGTAQSGVTENINTKATHEATHVCSNYNITEDTPTVLTEQMTKLDVGHNRDQRGSGLNADAAEFIPIPKQKFTTGNASVNSSTTSYSSTSSSGWSSEPSTGLKPSLSDGPGHLSHQTSTFSNSNRHQHRNNRPDIYKPIGVSTAENFEKQSRLQQKEITGEAYTIPLNQLYQKREVIVQGGTSQAHKNTNYIHSNDHGKAQSNHAAEGISDKDAKGNSEVILISDSESESTTNYGSSRSRRSKARRTPETTEDKYEKYHRSKSRDSSDSNNEKLSHRSKSREKNRTERKQKHGSKSRIKREKSNEDNYSGSGERKYGSKTHRSHSREKKHKHRSKSRDKKEKSNSEDNSGSGNRKHRTKTHRSRSRNTEEKSDAEDNFSGSGDRKNRTNSRAKQELSRNTSEPKIKDSRQRNVPSRSNKFDKNESFQNRNWKRDKKLNHSFAGSSEENWDKDLISASTETKEETTRSATSRDQIWHNSNRPTSYDTDTSDNRNSRSDNFSQDSAQWQQAKGGRNRGTHKRKPQTSRSDKYSQGNSRRQESSVDVSEQNWDDDHGAEESDRKTEESSSQLYEKCKTDSHSVDSTRGKSMSHQNRTQQNRRGMYNSNSYNRQKPFGRQAEMDTSGYNHTKDQIQCPTTEENWDDELKSDGSRQPSQNIASAWKPESYNPRTHNQLSVDTPEENLGDEVEPGVNMKPENEEGIAMVQRSFDRCSFNTDETTHSDSSPAGNWRNKKERQSWGSFGRDRKDKIELPQRKSLGEERQTRKFRDLRMERGTNMNWRDTSRTDDPEYEAFLEIERSDEEIKYVKVEEKTGDLFEMSKEYSLAHCVAEDLSMGSGIAVQFKREFKGLGELYDQRQKQGGLATLEQKHGDSKRYIYYLVTKRESSGKPTYYTFWSSVKKMRDHIRNNGVKKLAIPRLGCGLDRLEWSRVKPMVEFLFRDLDVEIVVCNFQQDADTPTKEQRGLYCRVVRETYHITQIESYSIIIYFSTEDGFISDEMLALQKKCNFISKFDQAKKALGEVVRFDDWNNNYILYGCIVRKNMNQPFHFASFVKCLAQINKQNKNDQIKYVGIPAVGDGIDPLLNFKIVNTAKTYLRNVDIYQCFGSEDGEKSPKDTENEDRVTSLDTSLEKEGGETNSKETKNEDVSSLNNTKDKWW